MAELLRALDDVKLGEALGLGLTNSQIGYLAGALFLALLGLAAFRRVTRLPGPWPAFWVAVGVGLTAGGWLLLVRGFPDEVPEELRPWAQTDQVLRLASVVALLGVSVIFLSAYWLREPASRLLTRLFAVGMAGVAVWLAVGWFRDQLPEEARPWAARTMVSRGFVVLGLVGLAGYLWVRPEREAPHRRWAKRALASPAAAVAVILGARWFGPVVTDDLPSDEVNRVSAIISVIAAGTCLVIAAGAYLLKGRRRRKPVRQRRADRVAPLPPSSPSRPLPVAVLLDEHGRPVLPPQPPAT